MKSIKIQIPSMTENIRIVESFIDNIKEKYHLNDDVYGNIMVAVTESVNNAIVHGNCADQSKNVHLSAIFEEGQVRFVIEDQGQGFDYTQLPDPTAAENLEKLGGRGIFLMKSLSDEILFNDNGRKAELIFYLS